MGGVEMGDPGGAAGVEHLGTCLRIGLAAELHRTERERRDMRAGFGGKLGHGRTLPRARARGNRGLQDGRV